MDLESNRNRFNDLLSKVDRKGISELIEFISTTDFFRAPASTRYHMNVEGGLCQHSLNVYDNLVKLNSMYGDMYDYDSVILVALLHDLSKTGQYEYYVQNKKVYGSGTLKDDVGNFHWTQVGAWKVKDPIDKEPVFSEHGVCSFLMVNEYVKLTTDELVAIINHHMDLDKTGAVRTDISEIYNRYPLAAMLHIADLMATYMDENAYRIDE